MKKNDLVSIVIPCYNQAQYLEEAVQSVLDQTYPNIEIIIINDGSTDNSEEIASHLQKQYPEKIRIILQENSGVAVARNNGIEEAKGEYILPFDADDILHEKMVESTLYAMQKYKVDIVSPNVQCFGTKSYLITPVSFPECTLLYSNCWVIASLFRKKVWETVGGYKINMKEGYEDWEFWINVYKHDFIFYHLPITLWRYRTKEISRDIIATTKDVYLKAKIILNHPELYTLPYLENAISVTKQTEDSPDLYFYQQSGLKNPSKSFFNNLIDFISEKTLNNKQIITIDDTKIGLCSLNNYENSESVQLLIRELKVNDILFYAPLKYETDTLQICTLAWDKQKGIITAIGNTFPFVPKSKREHPKSQLLAYQRLVEYQKKQLKQKELMYNQKVNLLTNKELMIQKKDKQINILQQNLQEQNNKFQKQYDEFQLLSNSIQEITLYPIKINPIRKYAAYKSMLQIYYNMKKN